MKPYIYTDEECAELFEKIFLIADWKWGTETEYPTKERILSIMVGLRKGCEDCKTMASCGRITAIWENNRVEFYFDMYTQ